MEETHDLKGNHGGASENFSGSIIYLDRKARGREGIRERVRVLTFHSFG